jgi:hypothetical protein
MMARGTGLLLLGKKNLYYPPEPEKKEEKY